MQGVPASNHAVCAGRLVRVLLDAAPDDIEVAEAVGTLVGEDGLIPDVVIADADVMVSGIRGIRFNDVFAVAEVVSPGVGNRKRDDEIKPPKYAAAGIPAFIRVEIEGDGAPWIEVFHLREGRYELATAAKAGETLTLTQPLPVSFDPAILTGRRRGS
ncbi:Uma2 family endonuclease [Nonomuraea rubra]